MPEKQKPGPDKLFPVVIRCRTTYENAADLQFLAERSGQSQSEVIRRLIHNEANDKRTIDELEVKRPA